MKLVKFRSEEVEEWSALYVDGKLDTVGDNYRIDDRIIELTGVEEREGNFLLGGKSYDDAAQTIEEIDQYEAGRSTREDEAAALEEQARQLLAKAKEIRG